MPLIKRSPSPADRDRLLEAVQARAEAARRLVIYDQETGFLAPWYFKLRLTEECNRSRRYGRPLSLVALQPEEAEAEKLRLWLHASLRATDLVCNHGNLFFLLLTETDGQGASDLTKRIAAEVPVSGVAGADFLGQPDHFQELVDAVEAAGARTAA
jgi:PleD family two-component response regulator